MSELNLDILLDYWEGQCRCCEYGLKCHECVQIHDDFLPAIRSLCEEVATLRAALAEALEKHERELYAAHERGWNDRDALLKVRMNDDD